MSEPTPTARPVVALYESYGAGADEIGPRVAEALGVPYHSQAFSSEQLEAAAEAPEEDRGVLSRVLAAMGGSYAHLEGPAVAAAQRDDHELLLENTRWVMAAARDGAVILGRNATLILGGWPGALRVRLDAPLEQRVERAARVAGIAPDRAARRQRREDEMRAEMSIRLYGWDPGDPTRYDLVVNTASLDVETCVDVIVHASRRRTARAVPAGTAPGGAS